VNEENWLVEQEREAEYATSYEVEGKEKGKGNNEIPIPAWPLFIIIPFAIYMGMRRQFRFENSLTQPAR